jgi:glycosyltransferase involved in cell wall biosynthesis
VTTLSQDLFAEFASRADEPFDLSLQAHLDEAQVLAERFLESIHKTSELELVEHELAAERGRIPLVVHLALKMARSRALLLEAETPPFLSVVFAVYKETERLQTATTHPHGEDFLNRKLAQLEWLTADIESAGFELIVVDDGCPDASGAAVRARAAELGARGERVRVLELDEAIAQGHPATRGLASADDSRKGGSIQLGLWEAAGKARGPGHIAIFTDADLSTHLGQCGLLAAPILGEGKRATIGSRRHVDSVVIKGGARNDRGKLFIYLWKGMLAPLGAITDTQCGFKAFRAEGLVELLENPLERQFAFDIELLLRCELASPGSIARAPVAWFDSEALSTTTDLAPYLSMLKKAAAMYRRYLPSEPAADRVATFIEELDEAGFGELLEAIPTAITDRDPRGFGTWRGVTPDELRAALA